MRCRTGGSIRNRNTAGTCNSYRLPAKTHKPIASVAAFPARLAGWQVIGWHRRPRNASKFVIARPQRGRGNLGKAAAFLPIAFPRFSRVLQDCHVGLRPPRNDTSGGSVVHQRPPAVEFPCAGRSLSAATPHTSAFPILTIACANRQCPMGRRGRRPLQRPTGSLVLTFHFPFPAFSLFSYNAY